MKRTYIISPDYQLPLGNLMQDIACRDVTKTYKVVFGEHKANMSDAQRRLTWMWNTEYAKANGTTKDHEHNRYKYKYVLPIMLADEKNTQLVALWERIRDDKDAIAALVRVIHSSDLDTAQASEALTEYDRDSAAHGTVFSDPQDLKREAFTEVVHEEVKC